MNREDRDDHDSRVPTPGPAKPAPGPAKPAPDADRGSPPTQGQKLLTGSRPAWRAVGSRVGHRINAMSYLSKWLILASIIGVIAGLGAIVFYLALTFATHIFLGVLAGYHVPTPSGEGNAPGSASFLRPWAIPLVLVLGGLLSGFLVFTWAPEAEGHGTDAAIDAVHHNPRGIRLRAVIIKIIASALTIGSGGSGGREGPTAQISAGFGSLLARVLDLSPEDGRIAVSVGIGSGIGAIFSAPLGGAVLAADVVYRDDFEFSALLPGVFASIIAYAIFGAAFGYQPLFAFGGTYHFQVVQLLWFAIIGLLAGGIGLLYSKGFYGVVKLNSRLPFSRKLRPAFGALFVGLIALAMPQVLGTGYGWVQKGLASELLHEPLIIILLLPLARIAATALSIGTGGSGGVFGPGMVIGAFTGLAVWRVLEPIAPGVGTNPAPYVVVAMMAVFGGISRAPLAVMLMVAQMTGNISLLAPAMVAVAIATFIVQRADDSIYRSQLRTRADSVASRFQFGLPLLSTIGVQSVASKPRVHLQESASAEEALAALAAAKVPGAPVVDDHGLFVGTVEASRLTDVVAEDPSTPLVRVLDATSTTVAVSATLDIGLEALAQAGGRWVTVTSGDRRILGILAVSDLVRGYRKALNSDIGRISQVTSSAVAVEERAGADSSLIGVPLRQAHLPSGCVILTVQRGEELIFATSSTEIAEGDTVSALASPGSVEEVRRRISGSATHEPPVVERGSHMV